MHPLPFQHPFGPGAVRATPADQQEAARHLERHGTYTHTGYPFMQLAKATGADYGDVLLFAQCVDPTKPYPLPTDQRSKLYERVPLEARERIDALMRLPVDQRGGNHFP